MRRKDRQMSAQWALEVFDKAPFVTVSMTGSDNMPYAVPLSVVRSDERTFYFHGAGEGRKIDILTANPSVCMTAVSRCRPVLDPKDRDYTLEFSSATAFGTAEIVSDMKEKVDALRLICERFFPNDMDGFEASLERSLDVTTVVRITLAEPPAGKRKQYDSNGEEMKWQRMQ